METSPASDIVLLRPDGLGGCSRFPETLHICNLPCSGDRIDKINLLLIPAKAEARVRNAIVGADR